MRTTVTLDEDVAAALRAVARERGQSFKVVLNAAVRRGLSETPPTRPYRLRARKMGLRPDANLDKALRMAGELEDEEVRRKIERGA